ncbi:MAG: ATPase, T2SS/T4P/T4SS family [Candidatus Hadarchaeales archaeon]
MRVAEFDCFGCEGPSSLDNPGCRACVLSRLAGEGDFDRVTIGREITRTYTSIELSRLATAMAAAKRAVVDALLHVEGRKSLDLDEKELEAVEGLFRAIMENPSGADEKTIRDVKRSFTKVYGKRGEGIFKEAMETVEGHLGEIKGLKRVSEDGYDRFFEVRAKPFFVDGLWHPPPRNATVIDSYKLPGGRGSVEIYEREDNPVPFYSVNLPEFGIPQEQLSLLYRAFRVEVDEAPGHARFARSGAIRSFAEEWYAALMQMLEGGDKRVSTEEVRDLARTMANWLTYRALEPLSHDDRITDIYVHAPPEMQPVVVDHERWGKLETGIYLTTPSLLGLGETLASRLGTAFDEIHPQLDAEIPELGMRLFLSRHPAIWPRSVEMAIRRRRSTPWTQPLFLDRGTLTPLASSMLGNLLRLGSSAFVIGEMGTAKTSQLETYIPEIGSDNRIVAFQDTEELHVDEFVRSGYKLANVRVSDPEHLERQVNAFLRGGASYWLITEVRAAEAVRAALGAAARQGSQPVVASFHSRSKREMFDLIVHIMGLHQAAFKYVDLIVSTARFTSRSGTVRRIVEVSEVLKDWSDRPEYVEMFSDNRKEDVLEPRNLFKGNRRTIEHANSQDLSKFSLEDAVRNLEFLPPENGGSHLIPDLCRRLALDEGEFLEGVLTEAKMKSDILMLARKSENPGFLELPFVSRAYNAYFSSVKRNAPDYRKVMEEWRNWLKKA